MVGAARNTLRFERLEPKQMLAGDVTVSLVGGNLLIKGDDAANNIAISSGNQAGSYVIKGLDGTAVHMAGSTTPAPDTGLVVTGVRGQVNVNLAGGDDTVSVDNATFRAGLSIQTGAGADTVNLGTAAAPPTAGGSLAAKARAAASTDASVNVRGSLSVSTGADGDSVHIDNTSVGGFLNVATDGGDDSVQIGAVATPAAAAATDGPTATVRAGLAIDVALGDGADNAQVNGASTYGLLLVGGGAGADAIGLHGVRAASLFVLGGDGDGADTVDVRGAKAFSAVIGTGAGNDQVTVGDSQFTALEVALGAGDDSLSIHTTKATQALLAGGAGAGDQLNNAGDNTIKHLVVTGFEIPDNANTPRPPHVIGVGPLAALLNRVFR